MFNLLDRVGEKMKLCFNFQVKLCRKFLVLSFRARIPLDKWRIAALCSVRYRLVLDFDVLEE